MSPHLCAFAVVTQTTELVAITRFRAFGGDRDPRLSARNRCPTHHRDFELACPNGNRWQHSDQQRLNEKCPVLKHHERGVWPACNPSQINLTRECVSRRAISGVVAHAGRCLGLLSNQRCGCSGRQQQGCGHNSAQTSHRCEHHRIVCLSSPFSAFLSSVAAKI